jgi:hypothetical protein
MTIRGSNYKRLPFDHYPTPTEVTEALLDVVKFRKKIYDPCCGKRRMILHAVRRRGYIARGSDIVGRPSVDFFKVTKDCKDDIITNPPYIGRAGKGALKFIERSLAITQRHRGKVAMLLPADFDSGSSRAHVFDHPAFDVKLVLRNRVRWFHGLTGRTNHAWFIWNWRRDPGPAILPAPAILAYTLIKWRR